MAHRSAGRNLRLITLGPVTWGWVVVTLMLLALVVLMAQARVFG
jgi:hypothetical protein